VRRSVAIAVMLAAVLLLSGCEQMVRAVGTAPDVATVRSENPSVGVDPTGESVDTSTPEAEVPDDPAASDAFQQ
jgi:PBP1b-binding outer membrane lipoprotein LpoB